MKPSALSAVIGQRLAGGLFHPPRKKHHRTPQEFNLTSSTKKIQTDDGIDLHLWLIPSEGTGVVILGHGIGLTKSASLRQAKLLHELGYHTVLFDHRNHGLSGTDPAKDHLAERYSRDIEACLKVASQTWPEAGAPTIWGFSFSTFPTLYSLRQPTSPPIQAIICDSGPGYNLRDVLTGFITHGGLPGPRFISHIARRPAITEAFATTAINMLGATWPPPPSLPTTSATPMLFLTGSKDQIMKPEQVKAIADLYPAATAIELPAHHLRGITETPDTYQEAVTDFLNRR